MITKRLGRPVAFRPARMRPAAVGGAVVALGLLLAGTTAAQQSPEGSPPRQRVETGQTANTLSPATIRALQHSLMQGGYAVDAADGVWGPRTTAAVREFQRIKGLNPTGRADRQTLAALGVTANGTMQPTPIRARKPADLARATIRAVQQALDKHGLKIGPADGVWGERTVSAIGNFQRARGMPASGELDAHTLAALGLLPGGSERPATSRPGQLLGAADLDPAAIRMIQQSLSQRGMDIGTPDGLWGDRTVNALRDFQRSQGIEPTGAPDVYTLAELGLLPGGETTPAASRRRSR